MRTLWRDITRIYTTCELTYPSDKLIALSGVAKIMAQVLHDEYCAGLWKSCLVTELCWSRAWGTQPGTLPSTGASTYGAPSWSWTSLDCAIAYSSLQYTTTRTPLINIIQCDVKTATVDRTGVVVDGILTLSGWLSTIQIYEITKLNADFFLNGEWWKNTHRSSVTMDYTLPTSKLHFLPLLYTHSVGKPIICGLLLFPTGTAVGRFRRVGIFSLDEGEELGSWKRCPQFVNEPWMEYEEACGDNKYTISIV
jgi:hypothetical protein